MTVLIYTMGVIITYIVGLFLFPFSYNSSRGFSEETQRKSYDTTLFLASLTWVLSVPIIITVVLLLMLMFIITTAGEWLGKLTQSIRRINL